jgi:hypothetical protein
MTEFCSEGSQASPSSPSDSVRFCEVPSVTKATKYEIWKISKGEGLQGRHAVQRGIREPTQHFKTL